MRNFKTIARAAGCAVAMASLAVPASAQFLRTSYFMEGVHYRQQLNPALSPGRGYINIPVVGSFNASITSNAFGYQDMLDIADNSADADYFMGNDFMSKLKDSNRLNFSLNTDILSAGWYKGKNFWSFNVGLKVDFGATMPKSVFEFMRHMNGEYDNFDKWNGNNFEIGEEKLEINSYAEVGVGYARQINDKLTVGGRAKVLLGIGNMKLEVNKINVGVDVKNGAGQYVGTTTDWGKIAKLGNLGSIRDPQEAAAILQYAQGQGIISVDNSNPYNPTIRPTVSGDAKIEVEATMETSFKGLEVEWKEDADHLDETGRPVELMDDFNFNSFGIAGWGLGFDLGASYKVMKNLTVSAALLDLGYIKWSKSSTEKATARFDDPVKYDFNQMTTVEEVADFAKTVSSGEILNYDMFQMKKDKAESRTTALQAKMVIGAEYSLLNDWLVVGALSTTHFTKPKTLTELTFSANIRPKNYFNVALSYSVIQSAGKSFGLAAKVGPVFVGTDYMFFGKKNTKCANAYLGISIPLNKRKDNSNG